MKTHLYLPLDDAALTLCGRQTGIITTDPEKADCETCKQRYANNSEWYALRVRIWQHGVCENCGKVIEVMAYQKSKWCSGACEDKGLAKEKENV